MRNLISKGLLIPTLFTLVGLVTLLSLGIWQLQRHEWKQGLIEQIEKRNKEAPISVDKAKRLWASEENADHTRIEAHGKLLHQKERHLFTVEKGQPGWRIFTPLRIDTGGHIFVDRGFVPVQLKDKALRRDGLIRRLVHVTGRLRAPSKKGYFSPENKLKENEFFWRSLDEMASSVSLGKQQSLATFFLEAEKIEPKLGQWPKAGIPRLNIPNKHMSYALTWFGLAIVLIAIFGIFARNKLKEN